MLIPKNKKDFLFFLFPKLRLIKFSFNTAKFFYRVHKNRNKMRFPIKLGIGSAIALVVIILFGFIAFPKMIKSKVKSMIKLTPGTEIRGMFTKVPFAIDFNIYMFNVTNPMEVQEGKKPNLKEVGPFCYEEWKTKVNLDDSEADDTMLYNAVDTFLPRKGKGCQSGEELITMPHPLLLAIVNTVSRQKPGMLTLISKAINSIWKNPTSIYLTAKASDILFDGIIIDCSPKDFAAKAVCTQLKTDAKDLKHISEDELAFSLIGPKNGTESKRFKVRRGSKDYHRVGWITEYDGISEMDVWTTKECNQIRGTDGTIFPPMLKKEEGLVSYAPDLCRTLPAVYQKMTKYQGIPVRLYTATLGDMSKNPDEKCFCTTPETCLKRGLMDLYKCAGAPIIASLPHFYDSDKSYLNAVTGLSPNEKKHAISILFEGMTGSPVYARKRLMFSMPLEPNPKIAIFANLPELYHPLFWVEEAIDLNKTYTGQLKTLFTMMKVVKVVNYIVLLGSLGGLAAAGYLMYKQGASLEISSVPKVKPTDVKPNGISTLGGTVNHAMSSSESEKY